MAEATCSCSRALAISVRAHRAVDASAHEGCALKRVALTAALVALAACTGLDTQAPRLADAGAGLEGGVDVRDAGVDGGVTDAGVRDGGIAVPDGGAARVDGGADAVQDDAMVMSSSFPATVLAREQFTARVTVENRGASVWVGGQGYALGGVDDEDPFSPARVGLGDAAVPPGGSHTFELAMRAPAVPGTYVSDWRMVHEHVRWFGPVTRHTLEVRAALGCSPPLPPELEYINVVVHNDLGDRKVLDATPMIHDRDYCTAVGFENRLRCPPRPEGHPETEACNEVAVGPARDTGRIGPTWTFDGLPCDGTGRCRNHAENQFLVVVWGRGTARACSAHGICGERLIE